MARVKFSKGVWVAVDLNDGAVITTSKERCALLHKLVIMGYARV